MIVLTEAVGLMFLVVIIFNKYNYKFDISLVMVALFLSSNMVEIYQGVVKLGFQRIRNKFFIFRKRKVEVI